MRTIYYSVVEYGDVLRLKKKKRKTVYFKRTLDYMFFTLFKILRRLSMQ